MMDRGAMMLPNLRAEHRQSRCAITVKRAPRLSGLNHFGTVNTSTIAVWRRWHKPLPLLQLLLV